MSPLSPQIIQQLLEGIPKVSLAVQPTPLHRLPRLSELVGGPQLFIKRDDLTGLAFGGNKARKLEFLLADALAQGADIIVTSAAAQSNMLRMTCAAARQLGLDIHLVMRGTGQEPIQGNLLLCHLFGAEISFIDTADPYSPLSRETMARLVANLKAQGRTPYIIDMRYQSGALATLGYFAAAAELQEQFNRLGLSQPTIVCSTGSGSTQAGLLLAGEVLESNFKVWGISVQQSSAKMRPRILKKVRETADLLGRPSTITPEQILLDDRWIGPAYGVPTPACIEALKLAARTEGIVMDPVYSGKGFSGLLGRIREGGFDPDDQIVFIHTGGTPALFAYAEQLYPEF